MPVLHTRFEVDWSGAGTFLDTGEVLDADLTAVSCRRGNDHDSFVVPGSTAGTLQAQLNNDDGRYSPFNASSPLAGNLLPGRRVRLRAGTDGYAALFTAANSETLSIADNAALSAGDVAIDIVGWFYFTTVPGFGNRAYIVTKGVLGAEYSISVLGNILGNRLEFDVRNTANTTTATAQHTTALVVGTWYFFRAYHDPTANTIGISLNNGAAITASTSGGVRDSNNALTFGGSGGSYLNGRLASVGIWKHATTLLTADQLAALYDNAAGVRYADLSSAIKTNLVAWWDLEEASGTREDSHSTNDLTDNNTVTQAAGLADYRTLFTGLLDRIEPYASLKSLPKAVLYASGVLVGLAGQNNRISPPAYDGGPTGALIDELLDAAMWPAGDRDIDHGNAEVGRVYFEDIEALEALRQIWEDVEGGFMYEDLNWGLRFEERSYRDVHSTVSQATFTDDGVGPLTYQRIEESDPLREIFNEVSVEVQPYQLGSLAVLWVLQGESVTLVAGESRTYFAKATTVEGLQVALVEPWTTPVVGTDIIQTGVANGDIGVSVFKTATTMGITVTNNHGSAPAAITMQARGVPVFSLDPFKLIDSDSASQTKYGRRTLPHPGKWFLNAAYAQASIDFTIAKVKDPHPIMAIEVVGGDAAHLEQMLDRAISDRITLEADGSYTQLGISQDFYIEAISHHMERGRLPRTIFELTPAVDLYGGESIFILDSSLLDGDHVLAY